MAQRLSVLVEITNQVRTKASFLSSRRSVTVGYCFLLITVIGIYVWVSVKTFLHPPNHSGFDNYWMYAYAGICLAIGILIWPWRGRLLLALCLLALAALLLIAVVRAHAGPALAMLLWLIILAQAMGDRLLRLVAGDADFSSSERAVFSIASGFGLISLLIFGVATAHLLYKWVVFGILVLLTLLLARSIIRFASGAFSLPPHIRSVLDKSDSRLIAFSTACCLVAFFGGFVWALAPETSFDALSYHLGVSEIYVQKHGLVELPYTFLSYLMGSPGMLYTLALSLVGQPLPQLIHLSFGLLLAAMTFLFGRRLVNDRVGLLGAVLLYTVPLVTWESGTAYTDLFVSLYAFGAVYAVLVWSRNGKNGWLNVGGLMAGLSVAAKLNAILVLIPAAVLVIYHLLRRSHSWKYGLKMVLWRLVLPGLVVSAPWFLVRGIWTSNPVFGLSTAVFDRPFWPGVKESFNFRWSSLNALLILPWNLTVNTNLFSETSLGGTLGIVPLLALPFFIPFLARTNSRSVHVTILVSLGGILLSFEAAPMARYLLPLVPIIAVLAALNLETLYQQVLKHSLFVGAIPVVAVLLGLTYLAANRAVNIVENWSIQERYPYRVALGLESREKFLSRVLPVYDAFEFLNRKEGGQAKVLSIGNEFRLYTTAQIEGVVGSSETFALASTADSLRLTKSLEERGYHYLLINWNLVRARPKLSQLPVVKDEFLSRYARLEFARHNVSIYRLAPSGADAATVLPNMLKNSSFEEINTKDAPDGWFAYGKPIIDQTANNSHDGKVAVRADKEDGLVTQVKIEPGRIYTLAHWTRADQPNQFARLQINWLDQNLKTVDVSIDVVPAMSRWTWRRLSVTAPDNAAFAQIYVSVHENSEVWFDDFNFVNGEIYGQQ